jgi:hypothetical protein
MSILISQTEIPWQNICSWFIMTQDKNVSTLVPSQLYAIVQTLTVSLFSDTAHHDFGIPNLVEGQHMRFATILFYLNEGMVGGETSFPWWLNAETPDQLFVTPEIGKAILFYSLLPDGNMDEKSLHAAKPVRSGEKWLTNLWCKLALCDMIRYELLLSVSHRHPSCSLGSYSMKQTGMHTSLG